MWSENTIISIFLVYRYFECGNLQGFMAAHGSHLLPSESHAVHATKVHTVWDVEAESSLTKAKGEPSISFIMTCFTLLMQRFSNFFQPRTLPSAPWHAHWVPCDPLSILTMYFDYFLTLSKWAGGRNVIPFKF